MFDLFGNTNWDAAYEFLASGSPPLILQLLAINTIFLILIILRRITGIHSRKGHSSHVVQLLLIFGNCAVLMQEELWPYATMVLGNLSIL